jgi:Domain of unknown function (DUF4372)
MTRFCSIFSQLLQLFAGPALQQAVVATQAERYARGFPCWGQFVAMLSSSGARIRSGRFAAGLPAARGGSRTWNHGASEKLAGLCERPSALAALPTDLLPAAGGCQALAGRRKKFRCKNKLLSFPALAAVRTESM